MGGTVEHIFELFRRAWTRLLDIGASYTERHATSLGHMFLDIADWLNRHAYSIGDFVVFVEVVVFLTLVGAAGVFTLLCLL
jgi:hypothetical protein